MGLTPVSVGQEFGVAGTDHPAHAVSPVDFGGADQVVHTGQVDLDAVDGVTSGCEACGHAGELREETAPLLDAHRLVPTPVDRGGRRGSGTDQAWDHGEDVVLVEGVIDAGRIQMHRDVTAVDHHLQVD